MPASIFQRLICGFSAFSIFAMSAFIYLSIVGHLRQWGLAQSGILQSSVIHGLGYLSIIALTLVVIGFFTSVALKLFKAWQKASVSLRAGFITTVLLWLCALAVMPVTEAIWPAGGYQGADISVYLLTSCLLFGVPTFVTFLCWVALDDRSHITILHRLIGSMLAGLLPGIFGITALVLAMYNPSSFRVGVYIGSLAIPFFLAFTFLCEKKAVPPLSNVR